MSLNVLPHRLGLLLALTAFAVTWAVGLCCGVPVDATALRSVLAGAAFWVAGMFAGRIILNSVSEAISDQMYQNDKDGATGKGR
jgi:hypothetical protein